MNFSLVFYIFGGLLKVEAVFLLLPFIVSLCFGEGPSWWYLIAAAGSLFLGYLLSFRKPKSNTFYEREGLVTVSGCWIIMSLIGALPLCLSGDIPNYLNALFETVSGFTTTGASILSNVEGLTHAGLFWRSFTHLVGGMGILVFMLTLTPAISGSSVHLMKAESPGPSVEKMTPKLRTTALYLYGIYLGLTIILIIFYLLGGVRFFDSLLLAFGTAGTGGFGILNDSFCSYGPYVRNVTAVFMLLFGINFSLYFLIISGRIKEALLSEELHFYLFAVFAAVFGIAIVILPQTDSFGQAFQDALFQVASLTSSTGFSSVDYEIWPLAAKMILLFMMFMGACAGSTGGGFKVSRILILLKGIRQEFYSFAHPHGVKVATFEGKPLKDDILRGTQVYATVYGLVFIVSLLILAFDKISFTTAFTSTLACVNNIGPGLDQAGPAMNYDFFSPLSKCVLIFDMLAGRLELYPVLFAIIPRKK